MKDFKQRLSVPEPDDFWDALLLAASGILSLYIGGRALYSHYRGWKAAKPDADGALKVVWRREPGVDEDVKEA